MRNLSIYDEHQLVSEFECADDLRGVFSLSRALVFCEVKPTEIQHESHTTQSNVPDNEQKQFNIQHRLQSKTVDFYLKI